MFRRLNRTHRLVVVESFLTLLIGQREGLVSHVGVEDDAEIPMLLVETVAHGLQQGEVCRLKSYFFGESRSEESGDGHGLCLFNGMLDELSLRSAHNLEQIGGAIARLTHPLEGDLVWVYEHYDVIILGHKTLNAAKKGAATCCDSFHCCWFFEICS